MTEQRGEAWVKSASAEEIVAAQNAGELATYLGGLTAEEQAQERVVAGTPDRVLASAYGVPTLRGNSGLSSNWFEAKRARMDASQLEKLSWVESAPAAEVYAAEQAGDLDHLMGKTPVPAASGSGEVR